MDSQEVTDVVMDATRAIVGVAARSIHEVSDEVTLAQLRLLVLVDARGDLAMGELADALGVTPSTATRLCDVLEAKGLLRREPMADNRRVVIATLTDDGLALVRRALDRRRALLGAAVARLTPAAQQRLARSLRDLTDALGAVSDHAWALAWPEEAAAPDQA